MSINDEWSRVEQNPDNMLVSDSLRESISQLFKNDETLKSIPPLGSLWKSDCRIDIELSRFEHTRDGHIIAGITSMQSGLTLISSDKMDWKGISVSTIPGADNIFKRDIAADTSLTIGVEFMEEAGLCAITLTFSKVSKQRQVL